VDGSCRIRYAPLASLDSARQSIGSTIYLFDLARSFDYCDADMLALGPRPDQSVARDAGITAANPGRASCTGKA
jgi:hypothetical protein